MFTNYLKITIRFLLKNKTHSLINILGLATGIACFLTILQYVDYEFSYEKFQEDHERIFRFCPDREYAGSPPPLAPLLFDDFPEIVNYVRIGKATWSEKVTLTTREKNHFADGFFLADTGFFNVFNYPLIAGDPSEVLVQPNSVVITETVARQYFGTLDVLGEILNYDDQHDLVITGIAEDVPHNSHFHFKFLAPYDLFEPWMNPENKTRGWGSYNYYTYFILNKGVDIKAFKKKLIQYADANYQDAVNFGFNEKIYFQPIHKIHLEIIRGNLEQGLDYKYMILYIIVAFLVLLIACVNFMNLSIAKSLSRKKEIGVRMVTGAFRKNIVVQFLSESVLVTLISVVIGFLLMEALLPGVSRVTNSIVSYNATDLLDITKVLLVIVIVGLTSGSLPALYVGRFNPTEIFSQKPTRNRGTVNLRKIFVVFQFFISIALILSAILVYKQLHLLQYRNTGFEKDHLISIPLYKDELKRNTEVITYEFRKNPDILSVTANTFLPNSDPWHQTVYWEGQRDDEWNSFWFMGIDDNFFDTYGIDIVEGRDFSTEFPADFTLGYIINESATRELGWEYPIGKKLSMLGSQNMGTVIGVAKDFNFRSLHHAIEPCAFKVLPGEYKQLTVKYSAEDHGSIVTFLENTWKEVYPYLPFEYAFIDQEFDKLYHTEFTAGKVIGIFTILSVALSCLGLLGLISFATEQRTREMGIRKTYGAVASNILLLLYKEYTRWILLAMLIAWPVGYYFLNRWLQNFEYRTAFTIWIFVSSFAITFVIAIATISYHSLKIALTNPVESLRYE